MHPNEPNDVEVLESFGVGDLGIVEVGKIGKEDPEGALAYLAEEPVRDAYDYTSVIRAGAPGDPARAIALMKHVPEDRLPEVAAQVIGRDVREGVDPTNYLTWLDEVDESAI